MTPDQEFDYFARQTNPDLSRRTFLSWAGRMGLGSAVAATGAATVGGGLLSACSHRGPQVLPPEPPLPDTIKVGVIAPFTGIGAFVGDIVDRSLKAAEQEINSKGGIGGRKVQVILRDTGQDPAKGPSSYDELSKMDGMAGILWCAGLGFDATYAAIRDDKYPIMAVFNDLQTSGKLYPNGDTPGRSVFQFFIPQDLHIDVLAEYAVKDRGYKTASLLNEKLLDTTGGARKSFEASCKKWGLENVGIEDYGVLDVDFGAQLGRLEKKKPHCLFVSGPLSKTTATLVKQLYQRGSDYIDRPAAMSTKRWRPHIFGAPGASGDKSWVELADADQPGAAKVGTLTVWHVGGLVYLPTFSISKWVKQYTGKDVTGGEESPADALATLLYGVKAAGTLDRERLVEAIETMGNIKFSSIEFGFTPDRHLSKTRDDLTLVTMERKRGPEKTDPAYELGQEWTSGAIPFPASPTQLVRPTLAANLRAHPDVMKLIMDGKWGTHCTVDGARLVPDCELH